MKKCPLCEKESQINSNDPLNKVFQIKCSTCGFFSITDRASDAVCSQEIKDKRIFISIFMREQTIKKLSPITLINSENDQVNIKPSVTIYDAINQFPEKFSGRVDKALMNLSKLSKHTGSELKISPETDYPILFVDSKNIDSISFMIRYLSESGLVDKDRSTYDCFSLTITPYGWDRIYELEKTNSVYLNQAFVAMWFDDDMSGVWENGFKKGIEDTGFTARRIDNVEHNNKICDEIIAEIRRSKFIVCDFTGQRGGVYFEAGFGLGLNIPVIWTCREDNVEELHFDTRQYSHIIWKDEIDIREKLRNRILATII